MKSLFIFFLCFIGSAATSFGQDTIMVEQNKRYDYFDDDHSDRKVIYYRDRRIRTRYMMLDIGFSDLYEKDNYFFDEFEAFELQLGKSLNINLHAVQQKISIYRNYFNFIYGLTFEFHQHAFDNPIRLVEDRLEATFERIDQVGLKKNRLGYTYLTLPVFFNIESNPRRFNSLHLSFGGYGGILLGGNFKVKSDNSKMKVKDNFNLNQFRYGLRGQVGFGPVTFYTQVALSQLFENQENGGYEVYPFSWGISILPF